MADMPEVGQQAPDFSVPSLNSEAVKLSDFKGKTVVLYFYPKDSTPGCTTEACDFRDSMQRVQKAGAVVLGASRDSLKRHKNFSEKNGLNFDLLSDEEGELTDSYGVWQEKKNYGRTYMGIVRSTFLIDAEGKIVERWSPVRVKGHAAAVIEAVEAL